MTYVLLGILVFLAAVVLDYAHARYVGSVQKRQVWHAVFWSTLQWSAGTLMFVLAVKVSLWMLPLEVLGLGIGTILAMRRAGAPADVHCTEARERSR